MVNEIYKIGLEFDVSDSLEKTVADAKKAIKKALEEGAQSAELKVGRQSTGVPGAATGRSIKQTVDVTAKDLPRQMKNALASDLSGLSKDLAEVTRAIKELNETLRRQKEIRTAGGVSPAGASREERRMAARQRGVSVLKQQVRDREKIIEGWTVPNSKEQKRDLQRLEKVRNALTKLQQENLQDARKLVQAENRLASAMNKEAAAREEAARRASKTPPGGGFAVSGQQPKREVVAEKQQGPTNIHQGANIDATRRGGSERTAGGGSGIGTAGILSDAPRIRDGRVGTREDKPSFHRDQEKSMQARERVETYQRGAEGRVADINQSLNELKTAIKSIPGFSGMSERELMAKLNFPTAAKVGQGAAPMLEDAAGQIKVAGGVIEMFGDTVTKTSNLITERVRRLMSPEGNFNEIKRGARRDPERALGRMRKEIAAIMELPTIEKEGRPRKPFQKGGEVMLRYTPTKEEQERLSALKNEAEVIAELNKIIYQHIQANKELRNELKKVGAEALLSPGLTETKAADVDILRGEGENGKKGPIEHITVPMQTRQLGTVGLGGQGGLARWTREFLVSQISDIKGGHAPSVTGYLEKELQEAGMILKSGFKEYKTALVSPDILPELREDQFFHDPKVVKMDMEEIKNVVVTKLGQGIEEGAKLSHQQVMGTIGPEGEEEQVKLDMTGTEAVVDRLEKVFVDGVEGIKVVYKELNKTTSGIKLVEHSGIKGISREADLEKMGFEPGTGVVMSMEGLAKRHGLRTVVEMMSHAISESTGTGAQEIADAIVAAMEEGGQSISEAVKGVATKFGASNFTGTMHVRGPLAEAAGGKLEVLAGKMAWARAPREGQTGPLKVKGRYIDPASMRALGARAETAKMAELWANNMKKTAAAHDELILSIQSARREFDATGTSLRTLHPEDLKRLPASGATKEDLKGTILDPDFADAVMLSIPDVKDVNKERMLRLPRTSDELGGRGSFKTKVGTIMANAITTQIDRIAEQASKVRGITGQTPLTEGSEAATEVAEVTSQAIKKEVADIREIMKVNKEEGIAAAEAFLKKVKPVIDSIAKTPVGFKYQTLGTGNKPVGKPQTVKGTVGEYLANQRKRGVMQEVYGVQDILAERAATVSTSKRTGVKTRSLEQMGRVHSDLGLLNKVMEAMGITLDHTSDSAQRAIKRLASLEEELLDMYTTAATTRAKPNLVEKRSMAASKEAGVSYAPMGVALQFRTDASKELEKVSTYLNEMAASGQDVGEAAAAYQRIAKAQEVSLPAVARDEVLINQKDFDRFVNEMSKELKISKTEAASRLMRTGLAQRYPITGEQSFMPAKLRPVPDEIMPEGKFGVAGTMAVSSAADLEKMIAPLKKMEEELLATAEDANYEGDAARAAGERLRALSPVIDKLRMHFVATALNLDFDGDKIAFHADMAKEASDGLQTFNEQLESGSVSFRKSLTQVLAQTKSPSGPQTTMKELEEMFSSGVAKGRPEHLKKAIAWTADEEKAKFEAMAHTAPKKSVGLLTDAFNALFIAVEAGGKKLTEGASTVMGQMMLGINKSLAQKHGAGQKAGTGPMEFIQMMKGGQLNQIFQLMDEGQGFFGELAKANDAMLSNMKRDLKRLAATEGAEGLTRLIKQEGLGIEVDPADLNKAIADILKTANIKNVVCQMFDMLKENMIKAVQEGGLTLKEAQESVEDMLKPTGKNGFVRGMNLAKIIETTAPGYSMTRKKGQEALAEMEPQQRAQTVIETLAEGAVSSFSDVTQASEKVASSANDASSALKTLAGAANVTKKVEDKFVYAIERMGAESFVGKPKATFGEASKEMLSMYNKEKAENPADDWGLREMANDMRIRAIPKEVAGNIEYGTSTQPYNYPEEYGRPELEGKMPTVGKLRVSEAGKATVEKLGEAVSRSVDEADLEASFDPREAAKGIKKKLDLWLAKLLKDTTYNVSIVSPEGMKAKTGSTTARGAFIKGSKTEGGSEGPVLLAQKTANFMKFVRKSLQEIAEGGNVDSTQLVKLSQALRSFFGVLEHESVHKASKDYAEAVQEVSRQLTTGSGVLGKYSEQIVGALGSRHEGIKKKLSYIEKLREAQEAGQITKTVRRRERLPSGEFGYVKKRVSIAKELEHAQTRFAEMISEELMAYAVQPEKWKDLGLDKLPKAVHDFVMGQIELLKSESGEGGGLLRDVSSFRNQLQSEILNFLQQSVSGMSGGGGGGPTLRPEDVGAVSAEAFPDAARFNRAVELLSGHERVIIEAAGAYKGTMSHITKGPTGLERQEGARGTRLSGMPEFTDINEEIKKINEAVIAGVAPDELASLQAKISKVAFSARSKIKALSKDPTLAGRMGGISPQEEYMNILREFQRNVATSMTQRARKLQAEIAEMRRAGKTDTPEFGALVDEFIGTIKRLHSYAGSTLGVTGRGVGTIASYAVSSPKGELLPSAAEIGVTPTPETFTSVMKSVSGRGKESTSFIKRLSGSIEDTITLLTKGEAPLEVWHNLLAKMVQYPKTFRVDLNKVIEIIATYSRMLGGSEGQFGQLAQDMQLVASQAKEAGKAVKNIKITSTQDIVGAMMGGGKGQRQAFASGAGKSFEESIDAQMIQMEKTMEDRRKKLQKLIETKGYKAIGGKGKQFEGMSFELIDPESGKVLQKFGVDFVRRGNKIVSTMKQIGAASHATSAQLRNAFRRVVQWGFASGAVYGVLRAFRALTQVVTEVQTKVAELKKVMDTSITSFGELQNAASDMGIAFGVGVESVLEGMVVYAQQGLKVSEIMERTKSTMLAMNVTTLKADEATEALTAVMKIFTDEVSNSEHAVDAWAAVAAKHAITAKELALAVQRSGAAAKTAGVSFEDFLGITTAIGSVTRQSGKEIATGTKFIFRAMRRPTAQKELLGVGVKSQSTKGQLRPAMDVLGDLAMRWSDLTKAQKLNIAQSMAGVRHYNQFIVLMENWQEVLDASADAQNSQGFSVRKNALAMETFAKQMQVLREGVKRLALDVGKSMLPAMTSLVNLAQTMIGVFNMIPDSLRTMGVVGAGAFLAIHKGMDLVVDTWDAFNGAGASEGVRETGLIASLLAVPSKLKGSFRGVGKVLKGATESVIETSSGEAVDKEFGAIAKGLVVVRSAASNAAAAFWGLSKIMKASIIGAVVSVVVALGMAWATAAKRGKEVEDEMYNQIGRIQDQINSLGAQEKGIRKVAHAWTQYTSSVKTAADSDKLKESIKSGDFKGPLVALKEYKETVSEVGTSLAALDPSSIRGISETGDYIFDASKGMENLVVSATDAKKATMAAMQTQVIKAYADELTKAVGVWDRLVEIMSLGTKHMDLLSQLDEVRDRINEITKVVQNEAAEGIMAPYTIQNRLNDSVEKELELRKEVALVAQGLKKNLESLPTFESLGLAQNVLGSSKIQEATKAAAIGGAYGKEATGASIRMHLMAKNLGLGGLIGGETTANANRFTQELVGKGLMPEVGGTTEAGSVKLLGKDVAKQLVMSFSEGIKADKITDSVVERARTVMVGLDDATGELVYFFENAADDSVKAVHQSQLGPALSNAIEAALTVSRAKIEEAAEKTKKLLTIQATGALAGIRIPTGGMPELGPAMFRDLTIDQRVLGSLPEDMQRLADVQSELDAITKRYTESLQDTGDETEVAAEALKSNVNTLDESTKQLVKNLKLEQFELTYLGHMETALHKLEQSLEQAAVAARDASIEEEARAELMKHTSGAMAGLPVAPQVDFGKSLRELSAQERLQVDLGPGFSRTLSRYAGVQAQRDKGVERVIDIRKQLADVNEMVSDLDTARGRLSEELRTSVEAQMNGVGKGEQMVMDMIQKTGEAQLGELEKQTPILDRILEYTKVQAEVASGVKTAKEAKEDLTSITKSINAQDLMKTMGAASPTMLENFFSEVLGLRKETGGQTFSIGTGSAKLSEDAQARLQNLMEAYNKFGKESADYTTHQGKYVSYSHPKEAKEDVKKATQSLLEIPEIADAARKYLAAKLKNEKEDKKSIEIQESVNRHAELIKKLADKKRELFEKLGLAEQEAVAQTEKATHALSGAGKGFALAEAAMNFALSIEATIRDFKKAEMLHYEKIGSDIEGPFARVGQPGFRNQFENKRQELENRFAGQPYTFEQGQKRFEEMNQLGFDEKEAKLKQQQDREVAALREQQSQAEKIRENIADALIGGTLKGMPDLESAARNYMDTLTDELSTSEQAKMVGGQLQFNGIPGLDDANRFLQTIQEAAKDQARKAEKQFQVDIAKMGNADVVRELQRGNQLTQEQIGLMRQPGGGAVTVGGTPTTSLGVPTNGVAPVSPAQAQKVINNATMGPGGMIPGLKESADLNNVIRNLNSELMTVGKTPSIYQGTEETNEASFVKEQTLPSFKGSGKSTMGALEDIIGLDQMYPGAQKIKPTSFFSPEELKGTGTLDLTNALSRMPTVGRTNSNLEAERQARLLGNPNATTQTIQDASRPGENTPGSVNARQNNARNEAANAQADALQSLLDATSETNDLLSKLIESGLQVPDSLGSQIEDVGTSIVDALGNTLSVSVTNSPLEIDTTGIGAAFSDALNSSNLGSVGADVSDALGRIAQLETVVDPEGGSVVDLISEATSKISSALDSTTQSVEEQGARLDQIESSLDGLPDFGDIELQLTENTDTLVELGPRVDSLETDFSTLESSVNDSITSVDASVQNLSKTVETNRLSTEISFRDQDQRIRAVETNITDLQRNVRDVQVKAGSALNIAQQALNLANRKT